MFEEYQISNWVDSAQGPEDTEFREAVHTILAAIASDPELCADMIIKGGILLAVRYRSHRYTKDIDFSTSKKLAEIDPEKLEDNLNECLALMTEQLDYELDCKVQSCKVQPANKPDAKYPSIKLKIGYAYKGTPKHKRLLAKLSPDSVAIDYSLNEEMPNVEKIEITGTDGILAYTLTDLIAEKYRSILQQIKRDRIRRQDSFDLYLLMAQYNDIDDDEKRRILDSLLVKAESREIRPTPDSLDDPDIRKRSEAEYSTLADEIEGELPDFNMVYETVNDFYKSLPW